MKQPQGIAIEVVLNGDESVPHISRLANPDRIILDFFSAVPQAGYRRINVNNSLVATIRVALFRDGRLGNAPVTRIVLDLERQAEYESRSEKGRFILRVFDQAKSAAETLPTKLPAPQIPTESKDLASNSVRKLTLNKVQVLQTGAITSVVLGFDGPVNAQCMTLKDPARFVMDFPGVTPATSLKHNNLSAGVVKSVRMALFQKQPPVLRVVLDQTQEIGRPALVTQGNEVIVQYPLESRALNVGAAAATGPSRTPKGPPSSPGKQRILDSAVETDDRASVVQPKPGKPALQPAVLPQATTVTYADGLLSIDAQNSTLTDVLYAVSEKTGAKIDLPFSDGMLDKIVFKAGPGRPREVLATMLQGTAYNYYIVENSSGGLDSVVLSPK